MAPVRVQEALWDRAGDGGSRGVVGGEEGTFAADRSRQDKRLYQLLGEWCHGLFLQPECLRLPHCALELPLPEQGGPGRLGLGVGQHARTVGHVDVNEALPRRRALLGEVESGQQSLHRLDCAREVSRVKLELRGRELRSQQLRVGSLGAHSLGRDELFAQLSAERLHLADAHLRERAERAIARGRVRLLLDAPVRAPGSCPRGHAIELYAWWQLAPPVLARQSRGERRSVAVSHDEREAHELQRRVRRGDWLGRWRGRVGHHAAGRGGGGRGENEPEQQRAERGVPHTLPTATHTGQAAGTTG
mmetsp:Transcript_30107/g.70321  ORF Transcript_30107/g.70321 Transcript_30107/m.70321 type:complete len:304 (-) Transcript_30107:11-922(-)